MGRLLLSIGAGTRPSPLPRGSCRADAAKLRPARNAVVSTALALVLPFTACAGGNDSKGAPSLRNSTDSTDSAGPTPSGTTSTDPSPGATSTPSAPDAEPDEVYCKDQEPFTGEAVEKFGAAEVEDAYCTFVALEMDNSFIDSYLRAGAGDLAVHDFSVWHDYMTRGTAHKWDATVEKALTSDDLQANQDVWSLMFYDALSGSGFVFTDEPAAVNRHFTAADIAVDAPEGRDRLILAFNVSADLNVRRDGHPDRPLLIHLDRRIVFALVRNPGVVDGKADWLIDSWTGTFTIGKPTAGSSP